MRTEFKVHVHNHYVQTFVRVWDSEHSYTERSVIGANAPAYIFNQDIAYKMMDAVCEMQNLGTRFDKFPYPAFLDIQITIPTGVISEGITVTCARYAEQGKGAVDFSQSFVGDIIPNEVRIAVITKLLTCVSLNDADNLLTLINSLISVSGKRFTKI